MTIDPSTMKAARLLSAQVEARRWQRFGDRCILTHNFEPTRDQAMWLATLDPRQALALAGLTSLETAGFKFFGSETTWIDRIRHKAHMRLAIHDITGGAEALTELDLAGLCRRFGLP